MEPNTLGRSGNLIEYETEHVLNGRLVLGTLTIEISRNPEEYKYNGGALSGGFRLHSHGEGETDVIMSLCGVNCHTLLPHPKKSLSRANARLSNGTGRGLRMLFCYDVVT